VIAPTPTFKRFMGIALVLLLGGQIAALIDRSRSKGSPSAAPTPSASVACLQLPARAPTPSWFPTDLPLPPGSFASSLPVQKSSQYRPYKQTIFVIKGSLPTFLRFAIDAWPKKGWLFGRGDVERGEADASFFRPNENKSGAFRARAQFCDQSWTWLYLILDLRGAGAVPSFSPHTSGSPLPSRSP
jgi:hypothetical protein